MLKGKAKKGKKPFLNFVEKCFTNSQPADSSVTSKGAGGQALMTLGQTKGKNETLSCYLCGKKGHIAKTLLVL